MTQTRKPFNACKLHIYTRLYGLGLSAFIHLLCHVEATLLDSSSSGVFGSRTTVATPRCLALKGWKAWVLNGSRLRETTWFINKGGNILCCSCGCAIWYLVVTHDLAYYGTLVYRTQYELTQGNGFRSQGHVAGSDQEEWGNFCSAKVDIRPGGMIVIWQRQD